MEEAAELGNYLPISFKSPKEQEYIDFLWDAFESNYTHGKYQFAFLERQHLLQHTGGAPTSAPSPSEGAPA